MRISGRILLAVAGFTGVAIAAPFLWPSSVDPPVHQRGYIDLHVHTAGIGAGDSGAFISPRLHDGFKFKIYLRAFGVSLEEVEREGDQIVIRKLATRIAQSQRITHAVLLALDGVVNSDGALDRNRTQVYLPNKFIADEVQKYDNLLFGASVNPYRADALERLAQVKAQGAVLIKWIPAIMAIDPADIRITAFYERMRDLKLPLLTHGGMERAFAEANDELGDPRRLALPLDIGVTVIVAHIASTGVIEGKDNFELLLPMFAKYENLYADISSLTQINKRGYLFDALKWPGASERLVYGSDWPLQFFPLVSPWYQLPDISFSTIKRIHSIANQWDRDVALKGAMGVPPEIFERSRTVLGR